MRVIKGCTETTTYGQSAPQEPAPASPWNQAIFYAQKRKKKKKKAEGEQGIPLQKAHDNLPYVE